jgi:hypothetical protein
LGVKAGINITSQTNAYETAGTGQQVNTPNGGYLIRPTGGVFTEIPISSHFLLRPQLLVSSEGFKSNSRYDLLGNVFATERRYTLNYLLLPVQLLYSMTLKFGTAWIGTGPYGGTLVNGYYKSASAKINVNIGNGKDDEFKSFDTGISSTIGLRLDNGFMFIIEQNTGLADVTTAGDKSRNMVWSLSIGYMIK